MVRYPSIRRLNILIFKRCGTNKNKTAKLLVFVQQLYMSIHAQICLPSYLRRKNLVPCSYSTSRISNGGGGGGGFPYERGGDARRLA